MAPMKTFLVCTLAVALAAIAFAKTETPKLTRARAEVRSVRCRTSLAG